MSLSSLRLLPAGLLFVISTALAQSNTDPAMSITADICLDASVSAAIDSRQIGEPVSAVIIDAVNWQQATESAPAHCRIDGRLEPVDNSDSARPIRFGVALPANWNRRSIQLGGGGLNGSIPMLAGRGAESELAQGYATYGSDSGHANNDTAWVLNDEAIRNLGYMQMKKTHDAAMVLIRRVYGEAPAFNYYVGGSQGGREGLTVVQRYPADYDGVLSTVPIVGFSTLMLAPTVMRQQERSLEHWVPPAKGRAILAEVMRQCDALDGLNDGVINNYLDCRAIFNINDATGTSSPWTALQCPDNIDPAPADDSTGACLTSGQIDTLHVIFSDFTPEATLPHGRSDFGMWMPTTAIATQFPAFGTMAPPGALLISQRYLGQEGAAEDAPPFSTLGSIGVNGFIMQDIDANPLDYDPELHSQRHAQIAQWLDSTQSDLGEYAGLGGKLIVIVGTDDTIAPSGEQLDYYQSVIDSMGQDAVDAFARLYVLPQTGHGLTGTSATINGNGESIEAVEIPVRTNRLKMLTDWVERGVAPEKTVVVTGSSGTRPMCSYPQYPHYQAGEQSAAEAYSCSAPGLDD